MSGNRKGRLAADIKLGQRVGAAALSDKKELFSSLFCFMDLRRF